MSEITNSTVNYHVYNLHEGDGLINQVSKVICVILPRGLITAGFTHQGDLLMIRYGDYDKNLPVWILDFFEHRFVDEPLLHKPENVIATYVVTDKYMLVPNALFHKNTAEQWMKSIFFVEDNEQIADHAFREAGMHYLYSLPTPIKGLASRSFPKSKFLPLAAYQLHQQYKPEHGILCCITSQQVQASMYQQGQLQWHQVFSYETVEDIAYHLHLLCKEHKLDASTIDIECFLAYNGLHYILNNLIPYFPNIRQMDSGVMTSNAQWASSVSLYQRLYTCAL